MKRHLLGAIALTAFASLPASAQTVITASSWLAPTHPLSMAQKEWCDLLEKNTSGKMKCNILPRQVANPPGTFDAIKNGLADVSFTVHGYTPSRFVLTKMAEFPFLGDASEPLSVAFDKVKGAKPEDEDKWQRAAASGGKPVDADKEKMSVLLAKLESIRAASFVDSTAKTGLDVPVMTVYAKFDDGKKEERVTFGKSGDAVYASRPGEPGAAKVSATEFDEINKKLDELAK